MKSSAPNTIRGGGNFARGNLSQSWGKKAYLKPVGGHDKSATMMAYQTLSVPLIEILPR